MSITEMATLWHVIIEKQNLEEALTYLGQAILKN